jgi:hypothetical protein
MAIALITSTTTDYRYEHVSKNEHRSFGQGDILKAYKALPHGKERIGISLIPVTVSQ